MKTLFSLTESPFHPDFNALYQVLGIAAERFDSASKGLTLNFSSKDSKPEYFSSRSIERTRNLRKSYGSNGDSNRMPSRASR